MIKLFDSSATSFSSFGLGAISDAISCYVEEELNGEYELTMLYPVDGRRYEGMMLRNIIVAPVNSNGDEQPFRIYRISKPMSGKVTVSARHIAYDMGGIILEPFEAASLGAALQALSAHSVPSCSFTFGTDKSVATAIKIDTPRTLWSMLGGSEGSLLNKYGGEWEFNKFSAYLNNKRGANRGVSIRYGKNLTSIEQDSNCASMYTGVYPFWKATEGEAMVTLPEKTVSVGTYSYSRILMLDCSQDFEEQPTEEQLRARATTYINANDIGVPSVSWTVEFAALERTEEYKGKALLERVYIGDTVSVEFAKLGVSATARAVKAKYNVLAKRYESITLGKVKSNLAQTISVQQKQIESKPSKTLVEQIAAALSDSILNAPGGYVRLLDSNGDGYANELYIADAYNPADAKKVWRFNYEGWAASDSGYNGPWKFGATLNNGLLADFVTAAKLTAGTIQSADGKSFYLNLDENVLQMQSISDMKSGLDQDIATTKSSLESDIAGVEKSVNESIIPLNELLNYIQVGNLGQNLYGVRIGKVDSQNTFKSIFTAEALEFWQQNIRTAFLSNMKLNATTVRTSAMQLVESKDMADDAAVDWEISMDNGFTIKYVGG